MSERTDCPDGFFAIVVDGEAVRAIRIADEIDMRSLIHCVADDPANWNDVTLIWPRYCNDESKTEFLDSLAVEVSGLNEAFDSAGESARWILIDLSQRRIVTGIHFPQLLVPPTPHTRDATSWPAVLPPWWELEQRTRTTFACSPRRSPWVVGNPRRDVLWGTAMTTFLAEQMLSAIQLGLDWSDVDPEGTERGNYQLSVAIHRDWLMTPCRALEGKIPRECLHYGVDWIDTLAEGQMIRLDRGEAPIPLSQEVSTFATAAMGSHEVILYFEACRSAIAAGWGWLLEDRNRIDKSDAVQSLSRAMDEHLEEWLEQPFEDGPTPEYIIECSRTRIPLIESEGHFSDCECPVCDTLASGMFGPAVSHYDGYVLESDGEFAFSIHATREAWEEDRLQWEEIDESEIDDDDEDDDEEDEMDDDTDEDEFLKYEFGEFDNEDDETNEEDTFESVWQSGPAIEDGIPGDTSGHLAMAFMVAELVGGLKYANADKESIEEVNTAFRRYRNARDGERVVASELFKQTLELVAAGYPGLVSQAADLQSRVDEQIRQHP